jgi:hypothetical protein
MLLPSELLHTDPQVVAVVTEEAEATEVDRQGATSRAYPGFEGYQECPWEADEVLARVEKFDR